MPAEADPAEGSQLFQGSPSLTGGGAEHGGGPGSLLENPG